MATPLRSWHARGRQRRRDLQRRQHDDVVDLCGTRIEHNDVVQHGSAIFFVTNDHSRDVRIHSSNLTNNLGGSWYPTYDQISGHSDTPIVVTRSVIGEIEID